MKVRDEADLRGTGFWTRLRIALTVGGNLLLAVGVVGALTWLATRPGLRKRIDLTAGELFTLQDVSRDVLENVPDDERIELDVFFQPLTQPLTRVGMQAQESALHVLRLVEQFRPDVFELTQHEPTPDPESRVPIDARKRELGIEDQNIVVVSRGQRREVLRLLGDLSVIDIGTPAGRQGTFKPPSVKEIHAEQAIVRAILKVAERSSTKLLFAWGQGERDLYGEEPEALGGLHTALVADGFEVARWTPDEDGRVPADCAVLAILAPETPFDEQARQWILEYLNGGGSLVIAPHYEVGDEPGSVRELLAQAGIRLGDGFVTGVYRDEAGNFVTGTARGSAMVLRENLLAPEHPITRPLRVGERSVRIGACRPLERGQRPAGAALIDILASPAETWADVPTGGANDWQPQDTEARGPFSLAMTSTFVPDTIGPTPDGAASAESRVFAIGTPEVFANMIFAYNRDFALNVFNWAAGREYRVNVSTRDLDLRRLDVRTGNALSVVNWVASRILPGACVLLGLFTFLRRRR